MPVWRRDGERGKPYALVITELGRKSLPIETSAQNPIAIATERSAGAAKGRALKGQPEATSSRARTNGKIRHARIAQHADVGQTSKNEATGANAPRPGSKLGGVIALLLRDKGASVEELTVVTGWLPHTTRAALTGLRKRGYVLLRERPEGRATAYRIPSLPHTPAEKGAVNGLTGYDAGEKTERGANFVARRSRGSVALTFIELASKNRDGAALVLDKTRNSFPWLELFCGRTADTTRIRLTRRSRRSLRCASRSSSAATT